MTMEGSSNPPVASDLCEMRAWVLAQLYWDASRDGRALVQEFLERQYTKQAAPLILQHMHAYTDEVDRTGAYVTASDPASAPYFTPKAILTSLASLDAAAAAAARAGDAEAANRVRALRVSPWFLLLENWVPACAWAKAHALAWPVERVLNDSLTSFLGNATALVGPALVASEAGAYPALVAQGNATCP